MTTRALRPFALLSLLSLALTGCSSATHGQSSEHDLSDEVGTSAHVQSVATKAKSKAPTTKTLPPAGGKVDYQLGGVYTPPKGVTIVTRDSTAKPAPGIYSICYVNGFQTQPGEKWADNLILHRSGKKVKDPDWPDEYLLDITTDSKRAAIAKKMTTTIKGCAAAGYRGVEFDNLDSYTRSKKQITVRATKAYATLLVKAAHKVHLAAGQKNTPQLGKSGKTSIGFDFAVAEECHTYNECPAYTKVYGKHVIDVEYTDNHRGSFAKACKDKTTPRSTILRDRDLVAKGHKGYVYQSC